ncbi:MAG: type II toxin-antitoxin system mRNA interferase toxin, RelE/StbE family [archaeon]
MYKIHTANSRAEKRLQNYMRVRSDVREKLDRLRQNPKKELGAHPLHGKLAGKWGCWLGSNIRIIYKIDDLNKIIFIEAVGSHKIY